MAETESVLLRLLWDGRAKCWMLRGQAGTAVHRLKVETDAPIDHAGLLLLLDAVRGEMESWLPY